MNENESNFVNPYEQIWKTRDLSSLDKPVEVENNLSPFRRGLGRFGKQMQEVGYALPALGAQAVENVIGENDITSGIVNWGLEGYKKAEEEASSGIYAPTVPNIENIKNASDAFDWASGILGEQLPLVAGMALTGGVGGLVARAGMGAVSGVAKAAVGSAVKQAVEKGALKAAAGQLITQEMKDVAAKELLATTMRGAAAGGFTGTAGLEGGLAFGEQTSQGVDPANAVMPSLAVGGINGALELVTPYVVAKKIGMGEYAKQSIKKIIETNPDLAKRAVAIAGEISSRAAKGAAEGALTEGLTESLQELTSIAGERWARSDPLFDKLTDEDWSRVINSGVAGAVVGGGLSGPGATLSGPHEKQDLSGGRGPGRPAPKQEKTPEEKLQELEKIKVNLGATLEAAKKEGDAEKAAEIQSVVDLYDNAINETKAQIKAIKNPPATEVPVTDVPLVQNKNSSNAPVPEVIPTKEAPMQEQVAPNANQEIPDTSLNNSDNPKDLSIEQVKSEIQRMTDEQNKRESLLKNSSKVEEYARKKGVTPKEMWELLRSDWRITATRLNKFNEYALSAITTADSIQPSVPPATPKEILSPVDNWDKADQSTRYKWLKDIGVSDGYAERKSAEWDTWDKIPEGRTKTDLEALGKTTPAPVEQPPVSEVSPTQSSETPVNPSPNTIQLKRGEEIILTPSGKNISQSTPEEQEKLRQFMGERPTIGEQPAPPSTEDNKPEPLYSKPIGKKSIPTFYSGLERALQDVKQEKASSPQWEGTLNSLIKNGVVKKEELEWSGTKDWLKEQKGPVTKEALLQHVRDNTLEVQETSLTDNPNIHVGDKFKSRSTEWTLPGGKNQHELVLTVPSIEPFNTNDTIHYGDVGGGRAVAWVRFNDRVDKDGKKTLFVEEIQSKRHQEAKEKGYAESSLAKERELLDNYSNTSIDIFEKIKEGTEKQNLTQEELDALYAEYDKSELAYTEQVKKVEKLEHAIPNAPFKQTIAGSGQTLSGWAGLAFKRMLRYAAENGYDKVAWTTGEQQARRYNLAQSVSKVVYTHDGYFQAYDRNGRVVISSRMNENEVSDYIGKELTNKLFAEPVKNGDRIVELAEDKVIGGEGMKGFYDRLLPNEINKYVKKWGAKVDQTQMQFGGESASVHSVEITPAMRDSVMQGQPLYSKPQEDTNAFKAWSRGYPVIEDAGNVKEKRIPNPEYANGSGLKYIIVNGLADVVKTGSPLVAKVYHGSANSDIKEFSVERLGENTGSESAKEGFFFSGNPETASSEEYLNERSTEDQTSIDLKINGAYPDFEKIQDNFIRTAIFELENNAYRLFSNNKDFIINNTIQGLRKGNPFFTEQANIESRAAADWLEQNRKSIELNVDFKEPPNSTMYPVYVRMSNPLVYDQRSEEYRESAYNDLVKQAKSEGHDGLVILNTYDGGPLDNIFVVFDNKNIKGYYNKGTFDETGKLLESRDTQNTQQTNIPLKDFHSNIDSIMGEGWLQKAIDLGLVEVIEGAGPNGESGSWVGDKIRLYTDTMPEGGSPAGVLLHEGKHHTFDEVLGDSLPEYVKDLHTLAANGNKIARDAITHATIITADLLGIKHNLRENGNKADLNAVRELIEQRRPGLLAEEELAYFVQYGVDAQTGIGFWKRLVNQIKAWFAQTRLGQRMKELGLGFELTDGMAVEWAKMGLNQTIAKLEKEAQVREKVLKEAANMPVSERLGRALAALEQLDPLYSFLGKNALTANLSKLGEAELRIKNGEDKESVRKDTGWFLNEADGKWRFEIDDSKADFQFPFEEFPESKLFKPEQAILLDDVLSHPELFKAYPQLKKISVIKRSGFMDFGGLQGWFDDDTLQIGITPYAKDPLSTLLHEIQHVVQMYEEFAKGGNENSVWNALPKETKENIAKSVLIKLDEDIGIEQSKLNLIDKIENDPSIKEAMANLTTRINETNKLWDEFNKGDKKSEEGIKKRDIWLKSQATHLNLQNNIANLLGLESYFKMSQDEQLIIYRISQSKATTTEIKKEAQNKLTDLLSKKAKVKTGDEKIIKAEANLYEFYRRLAGETEARLTQARQKMTAEERKNTSPESMQEYPYDQQIVVDQAANGMQVESATLNGEIDLVRSKYENTPQWMKAPNGKPTNLNEWQWLQVRTPAFKAWFGDWENDSTNKIVDVNKEPMVVYHGTTTDSNVISKSRYDSPAYWFTSDRLVADTYGKNLLSDEYKEGANVIPVFLKTNNPFIIDAKGSNWQFIKYSGKGLNNKEISDAYDIPLSTIESGNAVLDTNALAYFANQDGYDAVIFNNLHDSASINTSSSTIYVVYSSTQIKSAIANRGTFSSTESNILYSMGLKELSQQLWNDPTDPNQDIINKPGLLQKFRLHFIDFFAEMEKKSKDVYNAYSLLRSKKAARIEQARQEYYIPLRELIANSPWTAQEVGDMLAARHISIDRVNRKLAERASSKFILDLAKNLTNARRAAVLEGRKNILDGKMPDGKQYLDANGQPAKMSSRTMRQLMFNLMESYAVQEQPDPSGRQVVREEWELFKDAAAGFSDGGVGSNKVRKVSDILALANKDMAKFTQITNLFDAMNRHVLDILEQGKLITPAEHARLLLDKSAYAPLRRESYNFDKAVEELFRKGGQGGSKQVAVRTGTAALSEPTLVLQNALAKVEAAAAAAERNLANTQLYEVISQDKAGWKPWFSIVDKDVYVTHDEHGFLSEKNATGVNPSDIILIRDGKRLLIRPNMHNGRATGFVRSVNNLDSQILSGPMKVLNAVNQLVRAVNITFSPVFLMRNAIMDPFTSAYNLQASEASKYTGKIFGNYGRAFKMLKKVFFDGNRDPNDPDVQKVEEWENAGGRASFIDSLKQMDDTWRSFDAQVARRQGSMKYLMKVKDTWIDGIENFNLLFENVMRFSTFLTLVENNFAMKNGVVDTARAARISQDLTTNYTRRGYQTQMLGTWWLFFNASVQGSYQVVRNLISSPRLLKWSAATVGMAVMLDLLGRELEPDDWDKIPDWEKERNIILPFKIYGDFIKIPAPWVYNTLWRMGSMMGEVIAGKRKVQDFAIDTATIAATALSPLGKPGSIAQLVSPTAADPFVQILENKDFSGNPIGPEGYPGASKKANSELIWGNTPKGYQTFARFVNEATGGSAAESGAIDLKPGDYQLLANFLTGSLGRFLSDSTFGFTKNLEKGIEGPKDVPVIKEFFSDPYDPMSVKRYHTNIASIYGAHRLEQMYLRGPDRDLIKLQEVRQERGEELRMYAQAQDVERQLKSLRVRLRAAQKREDSAREKEIRMKMERIQDGFNTKYQQRIG